MNKRTIILIVSVLIAAVVVPSSSCLPGASRLTQELEDAKSQISTLETQLSESEASRSSLETELVNTQSALNAQQDNNSALAEELKKVKDPKHFSSIQELTDWLHEDDTDSEYRDADLLLQAFVLQTKALRDGYILPASVEIDFDTGDYYVSNLAVIGDLGCPQY